MRSTAALIALVAAFASASPILDRRTPANGTITLESISGDPNAHLRQINASSLAFYIGIDGGNACEPNLAAVPTDCTGEAASNTALEVGINGAATLFTEGTGFQQVFLNSTDGALSFVEAHSNTLPPDSIANSFEYDVDTKRFRTTLSGWFACPIEGKYTYQIYAEIDNPPTASSLPRTDCVGIAIQATQYSGVAPFQFN